MKDIIDSKFDATEYKVAVVDFWADWCMPCKTLLPIVTKLSNTMDGVVFLKANVEENSELVQKHRIGSIPTLIIFKDGMIFEKMTGLQSEAKIRETIQKAM